MKNLVLLTCLLLVGTSVLAATSVKVGETATLYCTASAPDGYITHAFFELADASDAQYLALYSHSSECYASLTGLKPNSNITINVTYAYTYMSYNNKRMVGHGTYTEKVSVIGGGPMTSMKFIPEQATIKVGESVKVKLEVMPANTSTAFEWGTGLYGQPYAFDISDIEKTSFTVTAKKTGKLYLIATSDISRYNTSCIITATEDGNNAAIEPTAITISFGQEKMVEGDKVKLKCSMEPDGATSTINWKSSNEDVATVDDYGNVKAVSEGKTQITATTANNKSAMMEIEVLTAATDITMPQSIEMYISYDYQLTPTLTPSNSALSCTWKSSDTSVATVTSGKIHARKVGTATITATLNNGKTTSCTVRVSDAPTNLVTYKVTTKINQIKNLARRTFDNK